jgi:PPOX class probable F420-dependent enzyme
MDLGAALDLARSTGRGVLATIRSNGRPQLSNIGFFVDDDGIIRVSVTATRAKTKNILRDPRVSLHVTGEKFYPYAVIEGTGDLSAVTTEVGDAAGLDLIDLYRSMSGEHPDWDDYQAAMIQEQRQVLRIRPARAYGMG